MSIQWFPGHMNKAKKAIAERIKNIDVVIEVLDARLPASSISPLLAKTVKNIPCLKILNKADLADEQRTQQWIEHFKKQNITDAIAIVALDNSGCLKVIKACRTLAPHRKGIEKPLRAMICGVPNVGKSTLINTMIGKKSAKTGNEAGITKAEQRLILADDFWLYDTPGMLWQKIIVPETGYNLALSGSVSKNAIDEEDIALYLISYLKNNYLKELQNRYSANELDQNTHDDEWLTHIAKRRGAVLSGNRVNYQKAAEIVVQDYRTGALGKITLETPDEFAAWLKTAQDAEKQKQQQKALIKEMRKKSF
ncbi:MAG: ribosome biogenesis GTPase YlqF [Neisseriaceae bacterium]|nr:ribosome biogenesis GTPase YlqF [Neisseriaceae bacterium]